MRRLSFRMRKFNIIAFGLSERQLPLVDAKEFEIIIGSPTRRWAQNRVS